MYRIPDPLGVPWLQKKIRENEHHLSLVQFVFGIDHAIQHLKWLRKKIGENEHHLGLVQFLFGIHLFGMHATLPKDLGYAI